MAQPRKSRSHPRDAGWNLEVAKARFGELVRRAQIEGPQRLTVGQDAVVVITAEEPSRRRPSASDSLPFVAFMESLNVDGLDLTRDRDLGRDTAI
jgi:hypothetical protein